MTTEKNKMLPVGTVLQGGKYRVVRYLSSGGFGNTYVVINTKFDDQLALKEFYMRNVNDRDDDNTVSVSNPGQTDLFNSQLRKFEREAQRLHKLHSDNVVQVHDLFEENGTSYYVMDFIQGESLSSMMERTVKPMPEEKVRKILDQLLNALEDVHKQNIWHLDIKPGNILVDETGKVTLIDFGASKQIDGGNGLDTTTTSMTGTPGYMPLEQMSKNLNNIGPWSDFYALGATLYYLLTMNKPLEANELIEKKDALCFPLGVSPQMQQLVRWMMQLSKSERPQSVSEIRRFLATGKIVDDEATVVTESTKTPISEKTEIIDNGINKKEDIPAVAAAVNKKSAESKEKVIIIEKKSGINIKKWIFWIFIAGLACKGIDLIVTNITKRAATPNAQEKEVIIANLKSNMIHVEGGTFIMGDPSESGTDDAPPHEVTVSSFSIGKYEVTQEEWVAVMGDNPSFFKDDKSESILNVISSHPSKYAKYPVERVSMDECQQFILKLNEYTGLRFRLPTEAEWEYAAMGGQKSKGYYYSGSNNIDSVAWRNDGTHEVGKKFPNELGIYDMSGNVSEWCSDYYGEYRTEAQTNPTGPSSGTSYVCRGGSWADGGYREYGKAFGDYISIAPKFTVFGRNEKTLGTTSNCIGLRLVLSE